MLNDTIDMWVYQYLGSKADGKTFNAHGDRSRSATFAFGERRVTGGWIGKAAL